MLASEKTSFDFWVVVASESGIAQVHLRAQGEDYEPYFLPTVVKISLSSSGMGIGLKALTFERPVLPSGKRLNR
jgi:hypothetical protein